MDGIGLLTNKTAARRFSEVTVHLWKPKELEGRTLTLSDKQKREQLERKCREQHGCCYWCGIAMTHEQERMRSATRDHLQPQPMGCSKDERDENIVAACWYCNYTKGSRRPA